MLFLLIPTKIPLPPKAKDLDKSNKKITTQHSLILYFIRKSTNEKTFLAYNLGYLPGRYIQRLVEGTLRVDKKGL